MRACAAETLSYFIQTMPDVPFGESDIVFRFAYKKDFPDCVKALCAECRPDRIITESQAQQLAEDIAANAIIGREKSAMAVSIDYKAEHYGFVCKEIPVVTDKNAVTAGFLGFD